MDLFMVLQLLCGLALFLFGMNSMGDGLESLSGGKLEKTLEKMTNSTMKGFILGAAVTADRKSTRLNSSHYQQSRMPSSA